MKIDENFKISLFEHTFDKNILNKHNLITYADITIFKIYSMTTGVKKTIPVSHS